MDLNEDPGFAAEQHPPDSRDVITIHSLDTPQSNGSSA